MSKDEAINVMKNSDLSKKVENYLMKKKKDIKRKYGGNRYRNMSEKDKQKIKEY